MYSCPHRHQLRVLLQSNQHHSVAKHHRALCLRARARLAVVSKRPPTWLGARDVSFRGKFPLPRADQLPVQRRGFLVVRSKLARESIIIPPLRSLPVCMCLSVRVPTVVAVRALLRRLKLALIVAGWHPRPVQSGGPHVGRARLHINLGAFQLRHARERGSTPTDARDIQRHASSSAPISRVVDVRSHYIQPLCIVGSYKILSAAIFIFPYVPQG